MPGKIELRESRKQKFINSSIEKYGDHYDYSFVEYHRNNIPVKIRCNVHDVVFEQRPGNHLMFGEYSCPVCNRNRLKSIEYVSHEEILARFHKKHGDKYDYSRFTEWKPYGSKIEIGCPYHGVFETHIHTHYKGGECPRCAHYKTSQLGGMNNIKDLDSELVHLYVVEFSSDKYSFLKVGLTSRSIQERFKPKQYSMFNKTTLLDREVPAIMGIELERTAIERFDSQRYYLPKSVAFKGCTELFKTCIKSDLLSLFGAENE
jgi:hypothetical protein